MGSDGLPSLPLNLSFLIGCRFGGHVGVPHSAAAIGFVEVPESVRGAGTPAVGFAGAQDGAPEEGAEDSQGPVTPASASEPDTGVPPC